MAHVGTITGSMTLDPSAYLAGLNRAAQATAAFRTSMTGSGMAFNQFGTNANNIAGMMGRFNTSIYASMTAFYALSRTISSSLGVFEEYSNIMSRISATADLSASSVNALSESFKKLNRELGGSRTDLMKGVYTAIQANFTRPSEFMPIGEAAMRLRTASGREIDTQKSADVISVVRNALGVRSGREGAITDMLLRGRDIGRYELKEMASALGIPITVFGNQFGARLGPEETLRQLIAILSSATQTGLAPRTAATGTRRLVEKTTRLASAPGGVGKNLTQALGSLGYGSISEALNEGPIPYLENILKLTGGRPEELAKLGFGAREFMLLSSSLRDNMGQTRQFYQELSPGNIAGTTDKYIDKHKDTWWYQRDRLRSAYEDTQISLMNALVPTMKSLANSLEVINDLFQALAPSIKQLIGLIALGAGASILKNFYMRGGGGVGRHNSFAMSPPRLENFGRIGPDFFRRGIRKPVIGTPAQRSYGNQIYGGPGNVFGNVHPSYYGGGISPVGWRPLNGSLASSSGVSRGAVRYNRRDTEGRFVPSWYNIRNAQGQLIPMSQNRMPSVSNPTFRERMLDRVGGAAMWASNALNNRPSYGSIPGMTGAIKAGAFMVGGQDYRVERIQDKYNSRIAAANEALKSGTMSAHRSASGLYKTLTGAGMGDVRASSEAANHLNKALNDVNQKFNQTAAAAQRSARSMGGVALALGTLGSVANMAAIGGIIQLVSSFISGLSGATRTSTSNGVVDMSKTGTKQNRYSYKNIWWKANQGMRFVGYALDGGDWRDDIATDMRDEWRKRGFIYDMDKRDYRAANMQDVAEYAIREKISVKDSSGLIRAGYNKNTGDIQNRFEKWLRSEGIEGITQPRFLQSTLADGTGGFDFTVNKFAEFLKTQQVQADVAKKTTEWIEKMGISARKAADSLALVKNFNMTAKQTDHIVEYLKNNYRAYFMSFISGAKQIETRGMLYDQQADRSLTPNEQSIWQSSGYREKMALAASDLFTPKHRFGGEDKFASFENWAKQQKENERYSGFGEYEDAKRNYFEASSNEQTASMLAVLLPKLATLSTSDARKQLEGIYGGKLNLDNVGIDRLRNTDLSRYFSEKPRDQLNSKSQFMSYGTTETYNSIVSMTPPEIIELQANRKAILDLQEAMTQNSKELLQDFDDKFEKFVADKLDKIVDNTAISANAALFGNKPDLVPSLDN